MKLDTYMSDNKINNRTAARALAISESQMSRLRAGHCRPEYDTLQKIYTWSNGEVTNNDFFPHKDPHKGAPNGTAKKGKRRGSRAKSRPAAGA